MNRDEQEELTGRRHVLHTPENEIDSVLHALGCARPAEHFEERLLARLAAAPRQESVRSAGRQRIPAWGWAGLVAACVCVAMYLHQAGRFVPSTAVSVAKHNTPQPPPAALPEAHVERSSGSGALTHSPQGTSRDAAPANEIAGSDDAGLQPKQRVTWRKIVVINTAVRTPAADQQSFPAPVMPLTEQERLLLVIAHRHDPAQIAMLDSAERDRTLRRERREDEQFFTPPPLPADVQRAINAALRSQYVNTAPPATLAGIAN